MIFADVDVTRDGKPVGRLSPAKYIYKSMGEGSQRTVVARHINAPGINTIVFTSTLVSIVMSVTGSVARPSLHPPVGRNTLRQIEIFLAYGLGGLAAAFVAWRHIPVIQWIPFIAVLAAIICCELTLPTNKK